jgi:hypothetical protein
MPPVSGVVYPEIPAGQSLLYVINYHSDEAQFHIFDQEGDYLIPGKSSVPDGGVLELFLDPGHYRWASVIQFANLRGEGEFDIAAGQIYGLGLAHGKVGPQDVVEGLALGPDPLSPPTTPSPTPIPIAPAPADGKVMLVLISSGSSGDILFPEQKYVLEANTRLFIEVDPGFQDINYVISGEGIGGTTIELNVGDTWNGRPDYEFKERDLNVKNINFQFELAADQICELYVEGEVSDQNPYCY